MWLIGLCSVLHRNTTLLVDDGVSTKAFESEKVNSGNLWFGDIWVRDIVDIEIVDAQTLRIRVRKY